MVTWPHKTSTSSKIMFLKGNLIQTTNFSKWQSDQICCFKSSDQQRLTSMKHVIFKFNIYFFLLANGDNHRKLNTEFDQFFEIHVLLHGVLMLKVITY